MNTKISDAAVEAAQRALYFAASPDATEADYIRDSQDEPDDAEDVREWTRAALAAALPHLSADAVPVEIPTGAIVNGAAFADRLERDYQFECQAGPLVNCSDYVEFRRCFDHLAQWASQLPTLYTHPQPAALNEVGVAAPGITDKWVLEYLDTDAPESSREAIRNAFTEWNSLADNGALRGGRITGWAMVDGVRVFSASSHSGILDDQQFVRYDDHVAALAATGKQRGGPDGWAFKVIDGKWAVSNPCCGMSHFLHAPSLHAWSCEQRMKPVDSSSQQGGEVQGDALLPCPFCGESAERIDFGPGAGDNEGGSCVACTGCGSSGPVEFGFKENFRSIWNRRARTDV